MLVFFIIGIKSGRQDNHHKIGMQAWFMRLQYKILIICL